MRGPGAPTRRSCSRLYCLSSALTVFQFRCVSRATSWIVEARHRRDPKGIFVENGLSARQARRSCYRPAVPASDPSSLDRHVDPVRAAREIPRTMGVAIGPRAMQPATGAAATFLERRVSGTTRAGGSPKTPVTVGPGRKPGNRYASQRRRFRRRVCIRSSCAHPGCSQDCTLNSDSSCPCPNRSQHCPLDREKTQKRDAQYLRSGDSTRDVLLHHLGRRHGVARRCVH